MLVYSQRRPDSVFGPPPQLQRFPLNMSQFTPSSKEGHFPGVFGQTSRCSGGTARDRLAAIFAQPLQPEVIQAYKALADVDGKAQLNLPALGLNAEDLATLSKEVTAA